MQILNNINTIRNICERSHVNDFYLVTIVAHSKIKRHLDFLENLNKYSSSFLMCVCVLFPFFALNPIIFMGFVNENLLLKHHFVGGGVSVFFSPLLLVTTVRFS